jgi:acetylglutamate kinase
MGSTSRDQRDIKQRKMKTLYVIKIGGNIIDDEEKLSSFLRSVASIDSYKIVVHGGGKLATKLADSLGIQQEMIDGRRITDAETLKIVTMVYAGYVNKNIVAQLQALDCNAIGLTGADNNLIEAHKRKHPSIDYGFVGDIDTVDEKGISHFLDLGLTPIIAPITHDKKGQLLNTNADTIAQEIAKTMSKDFEVQLIYSFEKSGVLLDAEDDQTVIPTLNRHYYSELKADKKIFAGMIPKIDNAFAALDSGVKKVIIGKAENLDKIIAGESGTAIIHE